MNEFVLEVKNKFADLAPKRRDWVPAAVFFATLFAFPQVSHARDLESAARTYAATVKNIGQVASVAGIVGGGILMAIPGVQHFGRNVAASALVGAACAFGAPAFVSFITGIFGA